MREEVIKILDTLTLEEKASLCSGLDNWRTKPIENKGVPSIRMSDGPHGLRKETKRKQNNASSIKAVCFPPAVAVACSWDKQLAEKIGAAIAEEALANEVSLILGPGVNIKRSPLCGRNFEYYSEDPLLSGTLATAMINGIQNAGVGACIKHFAVNNQEKLRMSISAEVDERALHEIYLKAFEIAIKEASPQAVMCSYNKINGEYASENQLLLTEILRDKLGFTGAVISDWGAVNDRVLGVQAGLDLEMPSSFGINDAKIVQAVKNGELSVEALDAAAYNVLNLVFTGTSQKVHNFSADMQKHHDLAVEGITKSIVLLRNSGILPLAKNSDIAVVGSMAKTPRFQGGGSSVINPYKVLNFLDVLGKACPYAPGYRMDSDENDEAMVKQAEDYAAKHKFVILFVGLTDICECEGYDRENLKLPKNQIELINRLSKINTNIILVLASGSPMQLPFADKTGAILYTSLGGEGLCEATKNIIFGEASPCGKLAETWPLELSDTPCCEHFPMGPNSVTYNESIFVGYRYYEKANKKVLFPFGFGLSYSKFSYENIKISKIELDKGDSLEISFDITNIGNFAAREICQMYIGLNSSGVYRAVKTLVQYACVDLDEKQTQKVIFKLKYDDFSIYSVDKHDFVVEAGEYDLYIGASSGDIRLQEIVMVNGEVIDLPVAYRPEGPYGDIENNVFDDEAFSKLHFHKPAPNNAPTLGKYDMDTALGSMTGSFMGKTVNRIAYFLAAHAMNFSPDKRANNKAAKAGANDLPFKNIVLNSHGKINHESAQKLLDVCNKNAKLSDFFKSL